VARRFETCGADVLRGGDQEQVWRKLVDDAGKVLGVKGSGGG